MTCHNCKTKLTAVPYVHVTKIAGYTVTDKSGLSLACPKCLEHSIDSEILAQYERRAVCHLLTAPPTIDGAVLKYARKTIGLTRTELGRLLGASERQIDAWETDSVVTRHARLALLGLVMCVEGGGDLQELWLAKGKEFVIGGPRKEPAPAA